MELFHILSLSLPLSPPLFSSSLSAFSPVKHFSIKRPGTFFSTSREEEERGVGCGCKGRVLVYNTSPREVLAVALSVGQPLHIIPIAASTGKLTYLQSLQPKLAHGACFPLLFFKIIFFDYCLVTWRPSKDTDPTHCATPAGERRAAERR